ncbi:MAG: hypothetical protein ABIQ30_04420 [Devosia sp.]
MTFSLTYSMLTGAGLRTVDTAAMAVNAHRGLIGAGATKIVIRDGGDLIVTLPGVRAEALRDLSLHEVV